MRYSTRGETGKVSDQALINQLSQNVFSAATRRMPIIIAFFYYIFKALIGVAAYVGKTLLRKKLGERTFGIITILFVYVLIYFVQGIILVWPDLVAEWQSLFNPGDSLLTKILGSGIVLFFPNNDVIAYAGIAELLDRMVGQGGLALESRLLWWLVIVISLFQFLNLYFRKKSKELVHSYFRGDSIFFDWLSGKSIGQLTITQGFVWRYMEPVFLCLISYLLEFGLMLEVIPVVLKVSAVCLFLEESLLQAENRKMVLDVMDSKIDAEYIASVQAGYYQDSRVDNLSNSEDSFLVK